MRRFAACVRRLGGEIEVVESAAGTDFGLDPRREASRFVQFLRFRDEAHHAAIRDAEAADPEAASLIAEFVSLVNLHAQRRDGTYAGSYYRALDISPAPQRPDDDEQVIDVAVEPAT